MNLGDIESSSAPVGVRTGSRLHLGLLSVPGLDDAATTRRFGGVGLMIEQPEICVSVEPAAMWTCSGPHGERALAAARRASPNGRPFRVFVGSCPAAHTGLGTGTQLAMAAGAAVRQAAGIATDAVELASLVGRGLRSGLGVHGFASGGFLVDGGKGPATAVAPLVARLEYPAEWRILLALPRHERGMSGETEASAFNDLRRTPADIGQTDALCRLVLLGLLPSLAECDLPAFGEAVFEFNRRAGLLFKASQGGEYASPAIAEVIAELRSMGLRGCGQSSWGPTVFAFADADRLNHAAGRLRDKHGDDRLVVQVVAARNRGQA
jgi:beta-ribofuranosylaminobenzene 5'-phosphate synthase